MRLVDCFVEILLYVRNFSRQLDVKSPIYNDVRDDLARMFNESKNCALHNGYVADTYNDAQYAVVAFVDELIMCSLWQEKETWQKEPLQRLYYDATNLGAGFYEKLNQLNKFGPDREVREVFSLCLGLGFRGKYFSSEYRQKYEEVKSFNLGVLLPEEAQRNIDSAILFPSAYGETLKRIKGDYRPRFNVIPYVIATPIILILVMAVYNNTSIMDALSSIAAMVN